MTLIDRLDIRNALVIDAIASGAVALLLLLGSTVLDSFFDLPTAFLRLTGACLLPWTALLLFFATRQSVSRMAVIGVIVANLAWVAGSMVLLATTWVDPNGLGIAFIVVQAAAVTTFVVLQIARLGDTESSTPPSFQA